MNRKLEILLAEFKDNLKTNYDLKKHEMICKKFSRFKDEFYNGFIHFNRNTNISIFNTITQVYITVYIDNLKEFKIKFIDYLNKYNIQKEIKKNREYIKKNNIKQDNLEITLSIYYGDDFFQYIEQDNLNVNRKNII